MFAQKVKGFIATAAAACSLAFGSAAVHASTVTWDSFTGSYGAPSFTQVGGVSTFTESTNNAPFGLATWTTQGTVSGNGSYTVNYELQGFFAFFNVTLNLNAYDPSGSHVILAEGPAFCGACNPPSGGFDYFGSYTFTGLNDGDIIGFTWTGNNGDSNRTMNSVLTLTEVNTQSVPEPFSLALLGAGLIGVAVSRRKKA